MELLLRLVGVLQNWLCWLLDPIFWLMAKLQTQVPIQPIRKPVLLMSATQLAAKIRTGELSCEDVVQQFAFRSRRVNVQVNAIVEERFAAALEEAEQVDQLIASKTKSEEELERETPLLGVPITVKESCKVKGLSLSVGCKLRAGLNADCDGAAVELLRKAGAIPILVSTTPEMCMANETYNLLNGVTKNPYDYTCTPGGSSGGEAALLAAAGSVVGVGSDLIASILCPAVFTGIFGHRPTPKVIPVRGHYPGGDNEELAEYLTVGPMTRYSEDLPLLTRIMAGDKAPLLRLDHQVDLKKLKVFYMTEVRHSLGLPSVDKEIKEAITRAVEHLCTTHGCTVDKMNFNEISDAFEMCRAKLFSTKHLPNIYTLTNQPPPKGFTSILEFVKSLFGLSTFSLPVHVFELLRGSYDSFPAEKTQMYQKQAGSLKKKMIDLLGEDGVVICPVYPTAAPHHYQTMMRLLSPVFCTLVTCLGLPSTSVPAGLNRSGLPIGFQVVAAPHQDRLCLAVARELEEVFGGWVPPPSLQHPSDLHNSH